MTVRRFANRSLIALSLLAAVAAAPADARRGGSFGSRGTRTYAAPRATNLTPGYVGPVSRSMTDRSTLGAPRYAPSYQSNYSQQRPSFFRGFGGGMLTGLLAGGLIGHFFGHGYGTGWGGGSGGGMLAVLFQLALLFGGIWLVMRLFGGRSAASSYGAGPAYSPGMAPAPGYAAPPATADLAIGRSDQDMFERLLIELQEAFGREDYARLRGIATPEVMSYLAEELSENATHGRRNEVTGTRLLDAEVSEAWAEDGEEYATVAFRYESTDVLRDRVSGAVVGGSPTPSVTTELWTFVRPAGAWNGWKVSAIQDA